MFIIIMLANATILIVLAFLIIYWVSKPASRKQNSEKDKQSPYRSVTKITHIVFGQINSAENKNG